MQEIQARGGRKTNFGKAAQRLRAQGALEKLVSWEDSLPERIRQNPGCVLKMSLSRCQAAVWWTREAHPFESRHYSAVVSSWR
jgi:hypothetical protein